MGRMRTIIPLMIISLMVGTGCVIEEERPLGADYDLDQSFNDLGVETGRKNEGVLTDMTMPDNRVRDLTKPSREIAENNKEISPRWEGYKQRQYGRGKRMASERPRALQDRTTRKNAPYVTRHEKLSEEDMGESDIMQKMKERLDHFNDVLDVHIAVDEGNYYIGIESANSSPERLKQMVRHTVTDLAPSENVHVFTDRRAVARIRAAEKAAGNEKSASIADLLKDMEYQLQEMEDLIRP